MNCLCVSGSDTVPGINSDPRTENQAKENVDRLFRFLIRKGVPIHSLTPKGEGFIYISETNGPILI